MAKNKRAIFRNRNNKLYKRKLSSNKRRTATRKHETSVLERENSINKKYAKWLKTVIHKSYEPLKEETTSEEEVNDLSESKT